MCRNYNNGIFSSYRTFVCSLKLINTNKNMNEKIKLVFNVLDNV